MHLALGEHANKETFVQSPGNLETDESHGHERVKVLLGEARCVALLLNVQTGQEGKGRFHIRNGRWFIVYAHRHTVVKNGEIPQDPPGIEVSKPSEDEEKKKITHSNSVDHFLLSINNNHVVVWEFAKRRGSYELRLVVNSHPLGRPAPVAKRTKTLASSVHMA